MFHRRDCPWQLQPIHCLPTDSAKCQYIGRTFPNYSGKASDGYLDSPSPPPHRAVVDPDAPRRVRRHEDLHHASLVQHSRHYQRRAAVSLHVAQKEAARHEVRRRRPEDSPKKHTELKPTTLLCDPLTSKHDGRQNLRISCFGTHATQGAAIRGCSRLLEGTQELPQNAVLRHMFCFVAHIPTINSTVGHEIFHRAAFLSRPLS